jgi:hypothetical protein
MTLRLDDQDHTYLKLLTIVTRKSANQIITDLLRAEYDRVFPGKREANAREPRPTAAESFRQATGRNRRRSPTRCGRRSIRRSIAPSRKHNGRARRPAVRPPRELTFVVDDTALAALFDVQRTAYDVWAGPRRRGGRWADKPLGRRP